MILISSGSLALSIIPEIITNNEFTNRVMSWIVFCGDVKGWSKNEEVRKHTHGQITNSLNSV